MATWEIPVEYHPEAATGDLFYLTLSNGKAVITSLAAGAAGTPLVSGGAGTAPSYSGAITLSGNQTITGTLAVTGTTSANGGLVTGAYTDTATGVTLAGTSPTRSGHLIVANASTDAATTFILPAASIGGGQLFTFVQGAASLGSNREVKVQTPAGSDLIVGVTTPAGGTGIATTAGASHGIKNTQATAVRGNFVTIMSDGVNTWYMTAISGIWAAY